MPAVLSSHVFLYPKSGRFPTEAALVELNPDNTVRLTTVDPDSGTRRNIMFEDSLADLHVWRAGTTLTFTETHDSNRWRVDFSPYNAGQRVITVQQANREVFTPSDASTWVAKLAELGYPTGSGRTASGRVIVLIILGVAIATVAVLLLVNLQHPIFG